MTLNELPIVETAGYFQPVQVNLITGDGLELDQAVEITCDKTIHLSFGQRTLPVNGHELACGGSTPFKPMSWFAAGSFTKWLNNVKSHKGYSICPECVLKREAICHI